MAYERPENELPLSPEEKPILLKQYFEYYRALSETNPSALNAKLPRSAFEDLLNELGEMLLAKSRSLASIEGPVGRQPVALSDRSTPTARVSGVLFGT